MTEPSAEALRKAHEIRAKVSWLPDNEDLEGAITQCEFFDYEVAQILDAFATQAVAAAEQAHFFKLVDREPKPFPPLMDAVAAECSKPAASDLERGHRTVTRLLEVGLQPALGITLNTRVLAENFALEFAAVRAEAVNAERERCAQIADREALESEKIKLVTVDSEGQECWQYAQETAENIATAIRAADDGANR